jgi:hypothetical protein
MHVNHRYQCGNAQASHKIDGGHDEPVVFTVPRDVSEIIQGKGLSTSFFHEIQRENLLQRVQLQIYDNLLAVKVVCKKEVEWEGSGRECYLVVRQCGSKLNHAEGEQPVDLSLFLYAHSHHMHSICMRLCWWL